MTERRQLQRPIGWWLKAADARIEQAFEDAFDDQMIDRRQWQVLDTLSGAPRREREVLQMLAAFDGAAAAVRQLCDRRLVAEAAAGELTLTRAGESAHAAAATAVGEVRNRVIAALPGQNYSHLICLLADLVDGLSQSTDLPR